MGPGQNCATIIFRYYENGNTSGTLCVISQVQCSIKQPVEEVRCKLLMLMLLLYLRQDEKSAINFFHADRQANLFSIFRAPSPSGVQFFSVKHDGRKGGNKGIEVNSENKLSEGKSKEKSEAMT